MIKHTSKHAISAGKSSGTYVPIHGHSPNVIKTKVETSSSRDSFASSNKPYAANVIKTKGGK